MRSLILAFALCVSTVAAADVTSGNPPPVRPMKPERLKKIRAALRKIEGGGHRDPSVSMFPGPQTQTRDEKRGVKEPVDPNGRLKP